MKIIICGSMTAAEEMIDVENELKKLGHEAVLPRNTHEWAEISDFDKKYSESVQNKIENNLIKRNYDTVKSGDVVLVVNVKRKEIDGYIGGNSFLEMGFAFILNKPIYLLNKIPEVNYKDEIEAMQPIILAGDLNKIR